MPQVHRGSVVALNRASSDRQRAQPCAVDGGASTLRIPGQRSAVARALSRIAGCQPPLATPASGCRRAHVRHTLAHAARDDCDIDLVDPVRGGEGHDEAALRDGRRPLRRAAAGPSGGRPRARCRSGDRFRFANHLTAWIEVEDGTITGCGTGRRRPDRLDDDAARQAGRHVQRGRAARPRARARGRRRLGAVHPDRRRPDRRARAPPGQPSAVRAGAGAAGLDARSRSRCTPTAGPTSGSRGASPFPRHWVYDDDGELIAKSGLIDFRTGIGTAFGKHTPWGDEDSPALVTAVETALERALSDQLMHGGATP